MTHPNLLGTELRILKFLVFLVLFLHSVFLNRLLDLYTLEQQRSLHLHLPIQTLAITQVSYLPTRLILANCILYPCSLGPHLRQYNGASS
jgi:hypothetical protein